MASVSDIFEIINKLYPVKISNEYCAMSGHHDNSGILIDNGDDVEGVLFSLDFSTNAINEAIKQGCNLIVTHHPAVFVALNKLVYTDPLGKRFLMAVKNGINVISMHLNMDLAKNGIDDFLMKAAGGSNPLTCENVTNGSYGRVYGISEIDLNEFAEKVKQELQADKVLVYGDKRKINKVASFCGAGVDDLAIRFAREMGADVVVSADMKHHNIVDMLESGLCVIAYTHYATENYGFEKIYNILKDKLGVCSCFYTDKKML